MAKKIETAKVEKVGRVDAANRVVSSCKGKTTLTELAAAADAMVVAGGGDTNMKASVHHVKRALATAEALGFVSLTRPTDTLVERK